MNSIISDLKHLIEGEISSAEADLVAVSKDFGGVVQKQPRVVVRPQNSADVAKAVKYASDRGLTISSRAAAHSLNGQALNQDGILLDMRSLNRVHELHADRLWFRADAGTTWQQIVDASLPHGVTPPVLTNNFEVTLGGTHSAAGLGQNSFRYGSQADNCLGLEVVTASGEILWCSPDQNSELFNHVLCGFGQFGIITQVQHRLRKYRPSTRTYFLCYDNLDQLLQDQRSLIQEERVDALLTLFSPCVMGFTRAGNGIKPLIRWFYRIQTTLEVDSVSDIDEDAFLSSLNFYRHIYTEDLNYEKFIQPVVQVPHPVETANPWLDVLLPMTAAKEYIETALERIPSFIDFRTTPMGSFSLLPRNTKVPMFSLPQDDMVLGFGMYPTIPKTRLQPVLEQLNHLTDLGFQKGGKRYLVSWVEFDRPQWRLQFGEYWTKVNEMKLKYDPQGILNPGFIRYEWETHPELTERQIQASELITVPSIAPVDVAEPVASERVASEQESNSSAKSIPISAIALMTIAVLFFLFFSVFSPSLAG